MDVTVSWLQNPGVPTLMSIWNKKRIKGKEASYKEDLIS